MKYPPTHNTTKIKNQNIFDPIETLRLLRPYRRGMKFNSGASIAQSLPHC